MRMIYFLFALLFASPACAQWQVPDHAIPTGRGAGVTGFGSVGPCATGVPVVGSGAATEPHCGVPSPAGGGTGVDNSAAVQNDVLAYNGTGFFHTALLSLINTVCTLTPGPCASLFGYYKPEWFGAVGDCATDDQTPVTNTIAAAVAGSTRAIGFSKACYAHIGVWEFGFNNLEVKFFGFVTLKELGATINVSIDAGPLASNFVNNVQFGRGNPPYLTGNAASTQNLFVRGVIHGSWVEARGGDTGTTAVNLEVDFAVGSVLRLIVNGNTGSVGSPTVPLITSKANTAILLRHRNDGEPISGCQIYVLADSMVNGVVLAGVGISSITGFSENNSVNDLFMQSLGADGNNNNVITDFDIEGIGGSAGLTLSSGNSANTFVGLSMGGTKNLLISAGNARNVFSGGIVASTLTDNGTNNIFEKMQAVTFSPNVATASWQRVYNGAGVYYPDRPYPPVLFATLPACSASYAGAIAEISDSTTSTYGATITGLGGNKVQGRCNSVNWVVAG